MIYHLVTESDLRSGTENGFYVPLSLAGEGFVHCSSGDSVVPVANDYYADVNERLLVLQVDPEKLAAETRYEAPAPIAGGGTGHLESATVFPHVYGPIECAAILGVGALGRDAGGYLWPEEFHSLESLLIG